MEVPPWELVNSTRGRAFRLSLPPDLSTAQLEFIRARLPKVWRLQRAGEPIGSVDSPPDDFSATRRLVSDAGRLKAEVLALETRKSQLVAENAELAHILATRRKRAKSLVSIVGDLLENIDLEKLEKEAT